MKAIPVTATKIGRTASFIVTGKVEGTKLLIGRQTVTNNTIQVIKTPMKILLRVLFCNSILICFLQMLSAFTGHSDGDGAG